MAVTRRNREPRPEPDRTGVVMIEPLTTEVRADAEDVARRSVAIIAREFRAAVAERGRFLLAVSGGTTPRRMLELLAEEDLAWSQLHLFQVDERVVPPSDPARNLAMLRTTLLERVAVRQDQIHPMPVGATDLDAAALEYAATLQEVAGVPPILDLVQLGLGTDGHTASLVTGDPALRSREDVAVTGPYEGARRMTLTFPIIGRARTILWVVTGSGKRNALSRLLRGDESIPAAHVPTGRAVLIADEAAIGAC